MEDVREGCRFLQGGLELGVGFQHGRRDEDGRVAEDGFGAGCYRVDEGGRCDLGRRFARIDTS